MFVCEHTDFGRAFTPGTVFRPDGDAIAVRQVEAPNLVLPTGAIVACDPYRLQTQANFPAFTRRVPPGEYAVTICVARFTHPARVEERVACAMVRFRRAAPRSWEMALLPGQDPARLPFGHFFGYGVDAGTGCFLDAGALPHFAREARELSRRMQKRSHGEHPFAARDVLDLATPLMRRFRESWAEAATPHGTAFVVDPRTGANVVAFPAGPGDGFYPSYWGLDRHGEPCCLVTDFGLLTETVVGEATFPLPAGRAQPLEHPDFAALDMRLEIKRDAAGRRYTLRIDGADQLTNGPVIRCGRREYHWTASTSTDGRRSTYRFELDKPCEGGEVVLTYRKGVRAL
jgi:hypothetical protein